MKNCIIDKNGKLSSKRVAGLIVIAVCVVAFALDGIGIANVNENMFFSLCPLGGGLIGVGVLEKK